ncbi:M3 family metallopeptidase [Nocardia sp. NPDC004654]|uniref:M3 family metallopeptidase n=1 Tax=Nocardia sp. NPDC004654 TaxID=3154776 RepID=UPI0033B978B3
MKQEPTQSARDGAGRNLRPSDRRGRQYSYIWSEEVLDADTVQWFEDGAAPIREKGETFRRELLSRGGSVDPLAAFASFRGRAPEIEPLLTRRGLVS